MSVRRQLYDLVSGLPNGDPVLRIMAVSDHLAGLPAEEVELAERRLLALSKAYDIEVKAGLKSTLDEFFNLVDAIEQTLVN